MKGHCKYSAVHLTFKQTEHLQPYNISKESSVSSSVGEETACCTSWMSSAKGLVNLLYGRCYCLRVKMYSTVRQGKKKKKEIMFVQCTT